MTGRPDAAGRRGTRTPPARRAAAARAVGWLAAAGAAGSAVMSLSHAGVTLPAVSGLGPGMGQAVVLPAVAAGFAVGAVLFGAVAVGAFRHRPWAWAAGVAVNGLTLASAALPFRGLPSALAIAVTLAALGVLLSRPGREALRPRPS